MVNNDPRISKPQKIIVPASMENTIDMNRIAANANQMATTFKPYFVTNVRTTYPEPVTTFHPKATAQTIPSIRSESPNNIISTYHPKSKPLQIISTYHPTKLLSEPNKIPTSQSSLVKETDYYAQTKTIDRSSEVTTMRPNVKHLLATIGLEPDVPSAQLSTKESIFDPSFLSTQLSTVPAKPKVTTTTISPTMTTKTTTTEKPELTPELKELLESFGLLTNEKPPSHITAEPYQDEFEPIFHNLKDESLSVNEFRPLPKSVTSTDIKDKIGGSLEISPDDFSSFKPLPIPDDIPGASNNEFESLLKDYGILESEKLRDMKSVDDLQSAATKIQDRSDTSTTLETIPESNRMEQVPEVDVAFLTPDLAKVLGAIGIKNVYNHKNEKTVKPNTNIIQTTETTTKIPVTTTTFASSKAPVTTTIEPLEADNDIQKLHHLLDTIRQLESLNANIAVNQSDSTNSKNINSLSNSVSSNNIPNPLDDFYLADGSEKNEVKRQLNSSAPTKVSLDLPGSTQVSTNKSNSDDFDIISNAELNDSKKNDSTTEESATTTTPNEREGKKEEKNDSESASSDSSSKTEEAKNGSLTDLADSFGGDTGLDPVSEEPLPLPKKNGFYFFSDWNSFLEVGEEPDKVVVRFDPKVGDPTQFVPVKIP